MKLCPTCSRELGTHQAWDLQTDRYYCSDHCLDKARGGELRSRSEMRRMAVQNPDALIQEIERLRSQIQSMRMFWEQLLDAVNMQAEDEALWSVPAEGTQPIAEAYLQQELRKLHRFVETKARAALGEGE